MLSEIARVALGNLGKDGFEAFVKYMLDHDKNFYNTRQLSDIDKRIFECPPERYFQSADAFILNYFPTALYRDFSLKNIDLVELKRLITNYLTNRKYSLWLPTDGTTIYSVNNYDSRVLGISDEALLDHYEACLKEVLPENVRLGLGNINTFLRQAEDNDHDAGKLVSSFFKEINDGLSISVSEKGVSSFYFLSGSEFPGITAHTHSIIHPVIKLVSLSNVLDKFNELLNKDTSEHELEEFLTEHYQFIFGEGYDRIETQLWIRFPELDIGNSNRRLDIFMRNSVTFDWELFELKRASVPLTKTIRDVPMLTNEVNNAIAQLRNYKYLLSQDRVRKQFEKDGIEYYQPEINLVIGRRPGISTEQWRRIISDVPSLRILNYDELYDSATNRLKAFTSVL